MTDEAAPRTPTPPSHPMYRDQLVEIEAVALAPAPSESAPSP